MTNDETGDLEVLARVVGATDALWEPRRGCRHLSGNGLQGDHSRMAVSEARDRYHRDGLLFLPPDRTAAGRQATAGRLARLSTAGWLQVHASSGKPARVKLTLSGDELIRRRCGWPTLRSSAGVFQRVVTLCKDRRVKRWKRNGCVSELALIHPRGVAGYDKIQPGAMGQMLWHLAPWLASGYVMSHETTLANAYLAPTQAGRDYFATLDPATVEADWVVGWQKQFDADYDAGLLADSEHLAGIALDTFKRERAGWLTAVPNDRNELWELPWSAT